ncbi:unnamed protein product [Rangifer tarandus platyrhynchus]|uniref:Uncharacterized protein n=2 Tax=Rangifer tarandus platyrhynchus TaxID=3082113 RepID=A0ABN8ZQ31_RANTA|nr:unnamed protein product [Rangifer tarandus platyrhynchus]CAI9709574.1 unnamed protein product [Rangifer tarandus platyrhynchus]
MGGASSPRPAAPSRGREAVAAAAAGPEQRGDWLRRAETSGSRGRSCGPGSARRSAVRLSAHRSEKVSCAVAPSAAAAAAAGLRR